VTKKAYKTMWVRAEMGILKEKVKNIRQVGTRKVTKTRGIINRETYEVDEPIFEEYEEWVPTGERSDTFIDIGDFSLNPCPHTHKNTDYPLKSTH